MVVPGMDGMADVLQVFKRAAMQTALAQPRR
jgi:hypothetical protein